MGELGARSVPGLSGLLRASGATQCNGVLPSVMQFKKGSFEVGGVIYPVAIKYDSMFGDAFWNR